MPKFKKKPVVIEAFQMCYQPPANLLDVKHEWPLWLLNGIIKGTATEGSVYIHANGLWVICTLEGIMEVNPGDFIIQGVKGELYPCKEEIFNLTYETV